MQGVLVISKNKLNTEIETIVPIIRNVKDDMITEINIFIKFKRIWCLALLLENIENLRQGQ